MLFSPSALSAPLLVLVSYLVNILMIYSIWSVSHIVLADVRGEEGESG